MNPARPDEQEEPIDMDDGTEPPDDSEERKAKVQNMASDSQRLASNPNIINK